MQIVRVDITFSDPKLWLDLDLSCLSILSIGLTSDKQVIKEPPYLWTHTHVEHLSHNLVCLDYLRLVLDLGPTDITYAALDVSGERYSAIFKVQRILLRYVDGTGAVTGVKGHSGAASLFRPAATCFRESAIKVYNPGALSHKSVSPYDSK